MQVSQIFLSEGNVPMGDTLAAYTHTVRRCFPDLSHVIYDDAGIRELLAAHFPTEVSSAYHKLVPFAYKADLARYCILSVLGGWYFDIGMRCISSLRLPEQVKLLAFRDINRYTLTTYACDNGIIFCQPSHPAPAKAIELILENCRQETYGLTPLCPTGPSLWGRAIALTGVDATCVFGDVMELTPHHARKNKALVLPDGTILAHKKPSAPGDLVALGAAGTNNYIQLWKQREIYR